MGAAASNLYIIRKLSERRIRLSNNTKLDNVALNAKFITHAHDIQREMGRSYWPPNVANVVSGGKKTKTGQIASHPWHRKPLIVPARTLIESTNSKCDNLNKTR